MARTAEKKEFIRPPLTEIPGHGFVNIKAGKELYFQGWPAKEATLLFEGVVLLIYDREPERERGRNDFYRLIPAQGIIGHEALTREPVHQATAVALTSLRVQKLTAQELARITDAGALRSISNALIQRLVEDNRRIDERRKFATEQGVELVDSALMEIGAWRKVYEDFPYFNQSAVAGFVGTSRESANKRIRYLKEAGNPLVRVVKPLKATF